MLEFWNCDMKLFSIKLKFFDSGLKFLNYELVFLQVSWIFLNEKCEIFKGILKSETNRRGQAPNILEDRAKLT